MTIGDGPTVVVAVTVEEGSSSRPEEHRDEAPTRNIPLDAKPDTIKDLTIDLCEDKNEDVIEDTIISKDFQECVVPSNADEKLELNEIDDTNNKKVRITEDLISPNVNNNKVTIIVLYNFQLKTYIILVIIISIK